MEYLDLVRRIRRTVAKKLTLLAQRPALRHAVVLAGVVNIAGDAARAECCLRVHVFADKRQQVADQLVQRPCADAPICAVCLGVVHFLLRVGVVFRPKVFKTAQLVADKTALKRRVIRDLRDRAVRAGVCVSLVTFVVLCLAENDVLIAVLLVPLDPHQRDGRHHVAVVSRVRNVRRGSRAVCAGVVVVRVEAVVLRAVRTHHAGVVVTHKPHISPAAVIKRARREVHKRRRHADRVIDVFDARRRVRLGDFDAVAVSLRPLSAQLVQDFLLVFKRRNKNFICHFYVSFAMIYSFPSSTPR